jgi:DNA end-binding protein Ku
MSEKDFEAAEPEGHRTIEIRAFVPHDEIDPIYFQRTYYLGPQENGEGVYALLVRAMEEAGLAAVGKYVMRDRQYLGCLRLREGVITLEQMYFADEIRPAEGLAPSGVRVKKEELAMATRLVEQYAGPFEPERFRDTYRDALCEIIQAKRKGEKVHVEAAEEPKPTTDLMAALRASVEAVQGRRSGSSSNGGGRGRDLGHLSKEELYELAKKADLPGRSDMSKDELVDALKAA